MSEEAIARAQARADRARVSLTDALAALRERLLPRTVARNLMEGAREKGIDAAEAGVDAVKARPGLAIGAAALAVLFLARKPIARAISREPDETPPPQARLHGEDPTKE